MTPTIIAHLPARSPIRRRRRPEQEITVDRLGAASAHEAGLATGGMGVSTGRPQPLRRWSVAELIARAAVAPPADGPARG
jgi:hypothetical protein